MRSRHDTCSASYTSKNSVPGPRPPRAHRPRLRRVAVAFDTTPIHAYPKVLLNPIVLSYPPRARTSSPDQDQADAVLRACGLTPSPGTLPWESGGHTCAEEGATRGAHGSRVPSTAKYISQNACAAALHMRSESPGEREGSRHFAPYANTTPPPGVSKPLLQIDPDGGASGRPELGVQQPP